MLNLTVAMNHILVTAVLLMQGPGIVSIAAPAPGQTLRGRVPVVATIDALSFQSGEVAFAYAENMSGTWFTIASFNSVTAGELLAAWDTSGIADGNYAVRIRVVLEDGTTADAVASDLAVRNESPAVPVPVATEAPAQAALEPGPALQEPAAAAEAGAEQRLAPPASPLPGISAAVSRVQVNTWISSGAALMLAVLVLIRLLSGLRRN